MTVPRWARAALRSANSCFLSPENDRATKVAPSSMANAQVSIGGRSLTTPVFSVDPRSAVGENWPLVEPVAPVVLDDVDDRQVAAHQVHELADANRPGVAVAAHADGDELAVGQEAPVPTDGMRPWTALKPCALPRIYAGLLLEQPMPESFTTCCRSTPISKKASMMRSEMALWPQPAHSVVLPPL